MVEVVAETPRLRLQGWDDASKAEFARVTNTPAALAAAFGRLDSYQRDHGHTFWAVERTSDGALLGFCGLKRVNSPGGEHLHGQVEIGWRFREDSWGEGYAKEAAIAAMDLAFNRFGAPYVVALTVPGNLPSLGLMKRLGMMRREDLDFSGAFAAGAGASETIIVCRIDAADWPAARAAALA